MTLPPSSSNVQNVPEQQASSGFHQLNAGVQHWIWKQKWPSFRPNQEQAIPLILNGETDVIISAATAGGKTEAAFLPIFSYIAEQEQTVGIQALCISPLKALINDQYRRLSEIGDDLEILVTQWHGDVDETKKTKLRKKPSGILIITK